MSPPADVVSSVAPDVVEHDNGGDKRAEDAEQTQSSSAPSTSSAAAGSSEPPAPSSSSPGDWQALWSAAHGAYYFYNSATQETTWTNPLQPATADPQASASTSSPEPEASTSTAPVGTATNWNMYAAAEAAGIDPSLAYLDPSLAAGPSNAPAGMYAAKFNARTGAFTALDGRDPSHLSEYERAKRMSEFYFDVKQWEQDVAARKAQEEAEGKKRKKPTKKDLDRFKEQKRLKKIAKTAWLRT